MGGTGEVRGVQCALCGDAIAQEGLDPVRLLVEVPHVEGSQELWVHWKCLRDRLHSSVPLLE